MAEFVQSLLSCMFTFCHPSLLLVLKPPIAFLLVGKEGIINQGSSYLAASFRDFLSSETLLGSDPSDSCKATSANLALSANPRRQYSAPIAAARKRGSLGSGRSSAIAVTERTWTPPLLGATRSTGARRENATWRWHAAEDVRLPCATCDGGDLLARQGRRRLTIDEPVSGCRGVNMLRLFLLPSTGLSAFLLRFFPFDGGVDVRLRDEHHPGVGSLRRGVSLSSTL